MGFASETTPAAAAVRDSRDCRILVVAGNGNNPQLKTKPVRPSRSVRTGDRGLLSCAGRSSNLLLSSPLLSRPGALSSYSLHAGPTPLGFHHSQPPPPPIAMTESLTSGRVLARARARAREQGAHARGPRVRRTKEKESFLPIPSFLPFTRPRCPFTGDTVARSLTPPLDLRGESFL